MSHTFEKHFTSLSGASSVPITWEGSVFMELHGNEPGINKQIGTTGLGRVWGKGGGWIAALLLRNQRYLCELRTRGLPAWGGRGGRGSEKEKKKMFEAGQKKPWIGNKLARLEALKSISELELRAERGTWLWVGGKNNEMELLCFLVF